MRSSNLARILLDIASIAARIIVLQSTIARIDAGLTASLIIVLQHIAHTDAGDRPWPEQVEDGRAQAVIDLAAKITEQTEGIDEFITEVASDLGTLAARFACRAAPSAASERWQSCSAHHR